MAERDPATPAWRQYASRTAASRALAGRVANELEGALAGGGVASLVVSGGTSPIDFFGFLRRERLDWSRVAVVASDEREVPLDHPDRNERMIRAELLAGPAAEAELVSLIDPAPTAVRARLAGLVPFACVVLGMGEDGHTASLFPGAPEIGGALSSTELCLTQRVPGLPSGRVTLTPRALLDSARIYLLVFGDNKAEIYREALEPGPAEKLPVRAVLRQDRVPVETFWAP